MTAEAIQNIYGGDKQQASRLKTRQVEARIAGLQSDDYTAQRALEGERLLEEQLRKDKMPPYLRSAILWRYRQGIGVGVEPETMLKESFGYMGYSSWSKREQAPAVEKFRGPPDLNVMDIGAEMLGEIDTGTLGAQQAAAQLPGATHIDNRTINNIGVVHNNDRDGMSVFTAGIEGGDDW